MILPRAAFVGVTESRGKFVADERRFPGLFPMPAWRLEQPGDSLYFWRSQQKEHASWFQHLKLAHRLKAPHSPQREIQRTGSPAPRASF